MSAIPCASVSLKTMADGTLRISFDIEPMHAQDAFRLFATPGTPAAVAALQVGYAAVQPAPMAVMGNPIAEKPKGGPLSKLAGMWCEEPDFQKWINAKYVLGEPIRGASGAADVIRKLCLIDSRAELDHDTRAEELFNSLFRGPYSKHLLAKG